MILIYFEQSIADIFRSLINKFPDAYLSKDSISYADLIKLKPEEIKSTFIEQAINKIMRNDLASWYELISKNHNISFSLVKPFMSDFAEIYYRRNLLVHNDLIVNDDYIKHVDKGWVKVTQIGERLSCDDKYLNHAFEITYIIIYGTILSLLKLEDSKEKLVDNLFNIGFNHLLKSEWKISKFIFYNLSNIKNGQSDSSRACARINYWISMKNNGMLVRLRKK